MGKRKNKSVQKRIEVKQKNQDRWRDKIKVQVEVTTKKEGHPKEIEDKIIVHVEGNPKMKYEKISVEEEKKPKIKTEVMRNKIEQRPQQQQIQRKPKNKKGFNILTERVFETRRAQIADQKRKDEYLKAVYKKMEEGHEEDFER